MRVGRENVVVVMAAVVRETASQAVAKVAAARVAAVDAAGRPQAPSVA